MRIKNYIVENYQLLMSCLEEDLCKSGISYVRIDNEIHFLDQIIRFYDMEVDLKPIIWWLFCEKETESTNKSFVSFLSIEEKKYKKEPYFNSDIEIYLKQQKPYQNRNKFIQKQESNKVNQKLKRYSK